MKITILANDAVLSNALRFLNSVAMFSNGTAVSYIPFDDNTAWCDRLFPLLGVKRVESDLQEIIEFRRRVYDASPPQQPWPLMSGKLRKLIIADLPKPVLYFDTDCILTSFLAPIAASDMASSVPLVYCSESPDWVYEPNMAEDLRAYSRFFSTGFLMFNDGFPKLAEILDMIEKDVKRFRTVTKKGVVDQPLLNYVADTLKLKPRSVHELFNFSSARTVGNRFEVREDWTVMCQDEPVLFLHEAGVFRGDPRLLFLFDAHLLGALKRLRKLLSETEFAQLATNVLNPVEH